MSRLSVAGVWALCAGLAVGCGGRDREGDDQAGSATAAGDARPEPITATGCLTASGDRFVLTNLERASEGAQGNAQQATEAYQLVGLGDDLRAHVGKQVRVNGEAEPSEVAEVRESTAPAPAPGATGTGGQQQPQVRTETETRMEVARLRVQSVTPTGDSCDAEVKEGAKPDEPRRQ